jgi:hypothetical protein
MQNKDDMSGFLEVFSFAEATRRRAPDFRRPSMPAVVAAREQPDST